MFNQMSQNAGPTKFILWLVVTLVGTLITRLSLIKIPCPGLQEGDWITTWLNFRKNTNGSLYFQLDQDSFSNFQRVYDYLETIRNSILIYYLADIGNRMDNWHQLWFLWVLIWIPIFGFIGQIKGMMFTISPWSLHHLSLQAKITLGLLLGLLVGLFGFECSLASTEGVLGWYLASMLVVPMVYWGLYRHYLANHGGHWHVHHWFCGFYLCLMTRFSHWISDLFLMIFFAVFMEGAIAFGTTPIIT